MTLPSTHQHLQLPEISSDLLRHRDWLESNAKPAWLLRASEGQVVNEGDSFLGGHTPYRLEGEPWPSCPHCQREMGFVMQVVLSDEMANTLFNLKVGTFQFWNCWSCLPSGDAYADARQLRTYKDGYVSYGPSRHLARWFEDQQVGFGPEHRSEQNYDFLKLLQPEPFLSLPQPDDEQFPEWTEEERRIYWDTFGAAYNQETISQVGGYPSWVQGHETPKDPATGQDADFVLALGTGDTDVIWGDTGFYYFFVQKGDLSRPFVLEQTL